MQENIRNIGIVAHVDAGKTTLSEQLLLLGGAIRTAGRVDEGMSTMDFLPQEQQRGITIRAGVASFQWKDCRVNFVDTPGHIDFSLDVERSLRVLDGAIAVFCGVRGVEPRSRAVWALADRYKVPRVAWINKLDLPGADFAGTVLEIEDAFGICALPVDWPVVRSGVVVGSVDLLRWTARELKDWKRRVLPEFPADWLGEAEAARERLLEEASRADMELTGQMLSGKVETETVLAALSRGCRQGRILPVCGGVAVRGWNCAAILDAAVEFLPAPEVPPDLEGHPGIALAFQTGRGPEGGRMAVVRSWSGTFRVGDAVRIGPDSKDEDRIQSLHRVFAEELKPVESAEAGDIFAVGLSDRIRPGDTLCAVGAWTALEPEPSRRMVLELALEAADAEGNERLREGLDAMVEEELGLEWALEAETGRCVIRGQGELQLDVVTDRLREEFGAKFRTGAVHVRRRERLAKASAVELDQVEWGGHHLRLRAGVEPCDGGVEVAWDSDAPPELRAAVEAGFREACTNGNRGKGALDGVLFSVKEWTSSQDAPALLGKRLADHLGPLLLREASVVVESPAVRVEILTPEEYLGAILQALQARGVEIQAVDTQRNGATITAISPLEPLLGCATLCRSLSKGLALVSLEPGGWVVESA
jgi:elongation factor G